MKLDTVAILLEYSPARRLWPAVYAILLGAEIDAESEEQTAGDTTKANHALSVSEVR